MRRGVLESWRGQEVYATIWKETRRRLTCFERERADQSGRERRRMGQALSVMEEGMGKEKRERRDKRWEEWKWIW